jgi:RNA binding exosome subunit
MKTNIFKTVLPALAILLAMGLSFAVEVTSVDQQGFYRNPITGLPQQVPGNVSCEEEENDFPCTHEGQQVYAELTLDTPLYQIIN